MPLSLVQQQKLTQEQIQIQSAIQVLASKLTELPIEGLRERVDAELAENPYLEASSAEGEAAAPHAEGDDSAGEPLEYDARQDYSSEDDIPDYLLHQQRDPNVVNETFDTGDSQSFYDQLMEQAREYTLSEHDRKVLEYIIGNLDDNGLLSKPLYQIADELVVYQYLHTTPEDVERVLHILWQFDPAGVGARSLQECLIIQCQRKGHHSKAGHSSMLLRLLENNWEEISHSRWDLIRQKYALSQQQTDILRQELRRLNPRPGSAMGEKPESTTTHITPDVLVEINQDGDIDITLNEGDLPSLSISEDATGMMDQSFVRDYVNRGRLFIEAIQKRRQTIMSTMQAIVQLQKQYFLTGDEDALKPMKLEDVAEITHRDLSTISRVTGSKYVETPYGTHALKWFFSSAAQGPDGETTSIRTLHQRLRYFIEHEDKHSPLSDDALANLLQKEGYEVARRTVAKYRESLGIPTSRMRKI